jgi:hypothetical protein
MSTSISFELGVMAGQSRPKDGVASLADVPAILTGLAQLCQKKRDARHKARHDAHNGWHAS